VTTSKSTPPATAGSRAQAHSAFAGAPARYATIVGTGRYVPEKMLTNADVGALLGESVDAWLREKVGIHERHIMADDETTSDLAVAAARQALGRAGVRADELDLIVIASDTPDYLSPCTASVVQAKLGAPRAGTYDVNCACASWVTALDIAGKSIATDPDYQTVLVVGAYGMSRYIDWKDKATCTLFADGPAPWSCAPPRRRASILRSSRRTANTMTPLASTPAAPIGRRRLTK
jgi:3-oxoacyl-(acyl-carrier-protein) synthase III